MKARSTFALALVLLAAPALGGCVNLGETLGSQSAGIPPVKDAYDTSRGWSQPLSPALYELLEGVKVFVEAADGTPLSVGVFRPAMEGCDWESDALPEACLLPVVMDAGPYYLDTVDRDKFRPPTVEWLVPRGYAVVQMSLRGTGESGGCYEFKSPRDVEDMGDVIDWLAAQPWSNGNVGMIGRSYDGTAAWSGAASGSPHLKTIVPVSGAVNGPHLYYKNGTSEGRGPIQPVGYYPYYAQGLAAGDPTYRAGHWAANVCEGQADDWTQGPASTVTGDASSPYWQSRDLRSRILQDYQGSAWVIHGLHDWNVNPSQVVPFIQEMQEAGIPTRAWLGVWGHAYPDRVDEHRNVRWDWADETVQWFDHWLKGEGAQPPLNVEVEDNLFVWRTEATYPPRDATWEEISFHGATVSAATRTVHVTEPLESALRIAGLPRLHFEAVPTTPTGGHVFAELYDVFPDGRQVRVGWGAINLQYHEGGNTDPRVLAPLDPVVAKMEFEPVDALVAEGHRLRLVLHKDGVEDVMESPDPSPVLVGESALLLPVVERGTGLAAHELPRVGNG